jgi:chromosome segregation ATPase
LQEINKQLREELKEMGALRADYAQLEALNKELKEQVKNKTLTIEELNNIINEYKQDKEVYSLKIFSSIRPSSSNIKAS